MKDDRADARRAVIEIRKHLAFKLTLLGHFVVAAGLRPEPRPTYRSIVAIGGRTFA